MAELAAPLVGVRAQIDHRVPPATGGPRCNRPEIAAQPFDLYRQGYEYYWKTHACLGSTLKYTMSSLLDLMSFDATDQIELIAGLDYTDDGRDLIVADRIGTVHVVDAETLEPFGQPVELDQTNLWAFAGPDRGTAIVLAIEDFALVDLEHGTVRQHGILGLDPQLGDLSSDEQRFAITGLGGEVRVLDTTTGEWVGPPRPGHDGIAAEAVYAPDGATFVTSGTDGAVALWDGRTGRSLGAVLPGRPGAFAQAQFLPDGHTVLIASIDGNVFTWDTSLQHWIQFACHAAGRNLTDDEWDDILPDRPYHETCPQP